MDRLPRDVTDHGGSLRAVRTAFPDAPTPWLDLSTGINPHPYPFLDLPPDALLRLPEPSRVTELARIAARAYGAPAPENVVTAPGTQILLPLVMALVAPGSAAVLSPTYAEHARAARLTGHAVSETAEFDALFDARLAIVVNPNNPDGRVVSRSALLHLADAMARKDGLLVVDEAFMDVGPQQESLAADVERQGLVILRSFGKFFGVAGLRLGFALANERLAERIGALLGPWAVSGPALEYGVAALGDLTWQEAIRKRLRAEASRLDVLLLHAGLTLRGGTSLYRFMRTPHAAAIANRLASAGIHVRRFEAMDDALRFGLPATDAEFMRLETALHSLGSIQDGAATHGPCPCIGSE